MVACHDPCYHLAMVYVQPEVDLTRPVWIEPESLPADLPPLHRDPLIAELLYRRGIRDVTVARDFLCPHPRHAPDPSRLANLDRAVERLLRAIARDERIAVFGDYDADGVTSTALLTHALRAAAGDVDRVIPWLPTRDQGYGLNRAAIDACAGSGATLMVAVDCASSDHDNVGHARAGGLDVIVLDHHHMDGPGPDGAIVVSAFQEPDGPYRELAAVGVAYLLVAALAQHGARIDGGDGGDPETALLDYVAIGTIGDVSPLVGANRPLVRDGLRRIRERPRAGVAALCRKAGLDPRTLTADQIAFKLSPRLNAAGRMGDPRLALDLLLANDPLAAAGYAEDVERLNAERRVESHRIAAEAEALLIRQPGLLDRRVLVVAGRGWSSGVLGIAANQLVARFGRPVVVLNDDGETSRGSARSIPGFDIVEALHSCRDLLTAHGGHSQAAGLSLPTNSLADLADALAAELDASGVPVPVRAELRIDADLPLDRLTADTVQLVDALQPFGVANEQPRFRLRGLTVRQYEVIGQDRRHLRIQLATPRGQVKAVAWGAAPRSRELLTHRTIDAVVALNLDHWNGQTRLDLEIKDFRPAQ